jgi:hypothetical protein
MATSTAPVAITLRANGKPWSCRLFQLENSKVVL